MSKIRSICVYCGSQPGENPIFMEAAAILGRIMVENDIRLVYGGGNSGIMGAVARSVIQHGGDVLGIIPDFLLDIERKNRMKDGIQLGEILVTQNMHERKRQMFEESDAFVALPGGVGTLEEIVEIMTWAQLGRHNKPMLFANVANFWKPMLELIEHMKSQGFIHSQNQMKPLIVDDPAKIVDVILKA